MELSLLSLAALSLLGGSFGFGVAVVLLGLVVALSANGGFYYSVPRFLLKWWARRHRRAL